MRTARECREEWRANKAQNQAQGITERAFVEQCRAGTAAAPMGAAPAPTAAAPAPPVAAPPPTTTGTAAAPAPYRRSATPAALPRATPTPSGANQFASEGEARARCPGGAVVWVNLKSHVYHFSGYRSYGTTKRGAYMCETDATADGFRAAKNEKHPT